jgi:membrane protease YdiL (CAAX protease family)
MKAATEGQDNGPASGTRPLASRIFVGGRGLRTGWSVLLFLLLAFGLCFGSLTALRAITHLHRRQTAIAPLPDLLQETTLLAGLFLATLIMAGIERRSVFSYGFQDDHRLARLAGGTIVGFLLISGLVGLLWITGSLAFDGIATHGLLAWKYAALWMAVFLVVGFFEEGLLRGYLQYALARGLTFWGAAVILSVLFGLLHVGNHGESPIGVLNAMLVGLVFCLGLRLTGSLWWVVGAHAGIGFAEGYFYGVPDSGLTMEGHLFTTHPIGDGFWSGGSAGPEGSVYALIPLALLAGGIWLRWGARRPAASPTPRKGSPRPASPG